MHNGLPRLYGGISHKKDGVTFFLPHLFLNVLLPFFMKFSQVFKQFRVLLLASLVLTGLGACTPKSLLPGTIVLDQAVPQINSNTWTVAATQRAGNVIAVELQYWSAIPIKEILLLQATARTQSGVVTRDTAVVSMQPYQAAFSQTKQCDTLLLTYTVPALTRSTGQTISINPIVRIVVDQGPVPGNKSRSFLTGAGFTWNP
jgi:hypothetical protein